MAEIAKGNKVEEKDMAAALMELAITIHRVFFKRTPTPLPINQFSVLCALYDEGTLGMHELADLLMMSKQQLTTIVEKLVKLGYVKKTERENDHRYIDIDMTEAGKTFAKDFKAKLREHMKEQFTHLTLADHDTIMASTATLMKVLAHMNATREHDGK